MAGKVIQHKCSVVLRTLDLQHFFRLLRRRVELLQLVQLVQPHDLNAVSISAEMRF